MRRVLAAFVFVFACSAPAFATWSVVALDQKTGAIVVASATCVPQRAFVTSMGAKGLMDIQAIVVPGKGAAAAQADVDRTRQNQNLIYAELRKGTDPAQILVLLKEDPRIERRQFGIVVMPDSRDRAIRPLRCTSKGRWKAPASGTRSRATS